MYQRWPINTQALIVPFIILHKKRLAWILGAVLYLATSFALNLTIQISAMLLILSVH